MTELYRGSNTPVFIDTTFVKRAQSFDVSRQRNVASVAEVNSQGYVGRIVEPSVYEGTLRVYEINQGIRAACGLAPSWLDYIRTPTEVDVACINGGISDAILSRVELFISTREPAQSTFRFVAAGWTTNATAAPAFDPNDAPIYMRESCSVSVGEKVQSARVSMGCQVQLIHEVNATGLKGRIITRPFAEIEIECLHPGTATWIEDEVSAQDIVVAAGTTAYSVGSCVSVGQPAQTSVRGWTATRYTYRSLTGNVTFLI